MYLSFGPTNWTEASDYPIDFVQGIGYYKQNGLDHWIFGKNNYEYCYTTNLGQSWTQLSSSAYHTHGSFAYSDVYSRLVSVNGGINNGNMYSDNAASTFTFAGGGNGSYDYLPAVVANPDGSFTATGGGGNGYQGFWHSTDGTSWSKFQTLTTVSAWQGITYGGTDLGQTKWMAWADGNGLLAASTGPSSNFSVIKTGTNKYALGLAYGNSVWVLAGQTYVGNNNYEPFLEISKDNGVSWTDISDNYPEENGSVVGAVALKGLVFYNGWFIAVNNTNKVLLGKMICRNIFGEKKIFSSK